MELSWLRVFLKFNQAFIVQRLFQNNNGEKIFFLLKLLPFMIYQEIFPLFTVCKVSDSLAGLFSLWQVVFENRMVYIYLNSEITNLTLPGRKKTLVMPNLKSSGSIPTALNSAWWNYIRVQYFKDSNRWISPSFFTIIAGWFLWNFDFFKQAKFHRNYDSKYSLSSFKTVYFSLEKVFESVV